MGLLSGLLPILKRDYWGVKSNTLLLVVILLFPMAFGFMFGTFKNIVPKSAPSAIFPEPGAGEEDMRAAGGILSYFSKTSIEKDFDKNKLFREEYYFFVGIPRGFRQGQQRIDVYVDASMSPVSELSPYVKEMILYGLSRRAGWEPEINVVQVGREILPFQYFVPGIVVLLAAAVGLIIVPFSLSQDKEVMSRVLASVSTASFVAGKLAFATVLALAQLAVLILTQLSAGTSQGAILYINPWTFITLVCAAVFFTSIGVAVAFFTRFEEAGKQINAGLLGATLVFSGAVYPVGFFPSLPVFGDVLQSVGRANPAYFLVVLMRGFGVRGIGPEVLLDYVALSLAFTVGSVLLLFYCVRRFKHG
jgi:hypothetical protein